MSGTSMDGIDISLVRTNGKQLIRKDKNYFYKYSNQTRKYFIEILKDPIHAINTKKTELDELVTIEHYKALKNSKFISQADLIGFHGQTIYHNFQKKMSVQLGNPILLAKLTKKEIASDFRKYDIKNNGQGAPLAPIYHQYLVKQMKVKLPTALVNIGGVSNITYIDKNHLIGFDAGPGNGLMDNYMQTFRDKFFDRDGLLASKGKINLDFANNFLKDAFFKKDFPKSLDRNEFNCHYKKLLKINLSDYDAMATLLECTLQSILIGLDLLPKKPNTLLVTGGGYKNKYLVERLKKNVKALLIPQDRINFSFDFVESELIAYLTGRIIHKLPSTYPSTTGVDRPTVSGQIYKI